MPDDTGQRPLAVIHAGVMRTGTLSMARAYDALGLRSYHGLDLTDLPFDQGWGHWAHFERAAEATWPDAASLVKKRPIASRKRFTRNDWEGLFGEYDAVTDIASVFADQLIDAYPEAKVVVVQRSFDTWWTSFQTQIIDKAFPPAPGDAFMAVMEPLTGMRGAKAMKIILLGSLGVRSVDEMRSKEVCRRFYDSYYARIREMVPPERRLEYSLGDGWEPLCKFLGKPVPDIPFPRVNDSAEHQARTGQTLRRLLGLAFATVTPWALGAVVVGTLGMIVFRLI